MGATNEIKKLKVIAILINTLGVLVIIFDFFIQPYFGVFLEAIWAYFVMFAFILFVIIHVAIHRKKKKIINTATSTNTL